MKNIFSIAVLFLSFQAFSQVPLNWTRDEVNPGEDFTLTPDESFFTEGMKSCHLQLNSGSIPYLKSDVFYTTPGTAYGFSFDVFDNDTAGQVKVYADFYDVYGFDIFDHAPVFSADSSEWQTISWTGTVPMQAAVGYVLIKFYNQPDLYNFTKTAQIWLDNIQFSQDGGDNLVLNGGFEDWLVGFDEAGQDEGFLSVYPNPARNIINIRIAEKVDFITVNDITGRDILRVPVSGRDLIQTDISHLQKGLYFVRGFLSGKSVAAYKLQIY